MTNETSYAPITYVCNGVSVDFAFSWKIFEEKDLIVQIQDSDGNITDLVLGVDYSVEFDEVGGNIKLNQTYAEGDLVVISRNVSDYQSKSYSTSSGFQSSEIEDSFDRVSCNLQEMEYNIENFKEVFSQTVNQEIDILEGVIEENKQEVLVIQERFEDEVNTKIQEVSEAAGKINALEQAVLDAQASADVAAEKAQEATEAIEEVKAEGEKQLQNIESTGFYMRDDKLYFINSKGEEEEFKSGSGSGFNLFDTKISDHILEGEEATGWALQGTYVTKESYPDFYNKCLEEKSNATATETTLAESTLIMFVNNNGHQFYNISDKSIVDTFYDSFGIADFYGIDEENERIFLPRNKYFAIQGVASVVGNGQQINLTDVSNTSVNYGLRHFAIGTNSYGLNAGSTATYTVGLSTNADKSGIEAHIQPDNNKYLYYCVGNTEVISSITNITEITESENDSNPLGSSFYFNNIQPNAGWLKSEGQWNDGNIYKTFYNWLVEEKTTNTSRTDIKDVSEVYTDFDYVLNQDDMTFRLPLLNGDESIMSNKYDDIDFPNTTTFTAPANGWYYIHHLAESASNFITISRADKAFADMVSTRILTVANNWAMFVYMQAYKGEQIKITSTSTKPVEYARFYYAKGNGDLYFKVANAVQNLELLDAGEVLESLSSKLDRGNKEEIVSWGVPDYDNGIILNGTSSLPFTAPTAGFINACVQSSGELSLYVNGNLVWRRDSTQSTYGWAFSILVDKGDVITQNNLNASTKFYYFPVKGAN